MSISDILCICVGTKSTELCKNQLFRCLRYAVLNIAAITNAIAVHKKKPDSPGQFLVNLYLQVQGQVSQYVGPFKTPSEFMLLRNPLYYVEIKFLAVKDIQL